MNFFTFLFVPMIIFLVVVAPVWIVMHYRHVNRSSQSLNEEDRENIDSMLATIDKLQDRIQALESLLDTDQPSWRNPAQTHTKVSGE
ncbi:MAG: pspB [Gammaproteobacteria bacterium]|nr:pspB [Gammaproteobacteria bacterium]